MVRAPSVDKNGLKKGAWSEEEDNKLRAYVLRYGHWNWRQLPKFAGLSRCGKSCRLRWMNYLKPGIKRGNFSKDEDEMIIQLHKELGNRWSAIAAKLPGRSDNEIKNHWHTHLKKRHQMKQDRKIIESTEQINETAQYVSSDLVDQSSENFQKTKITEDQTAIYDAISPYSQGTSSSEVSSLSSNSTDLSCKMVWTLTEEGMTSSQSFEETFECFWDDLFFADASYSTPESEGGFMSPNNSMEKEEFTLPYSLFGDDDINFLHNFMQ